MDKGNNNNKRPGTSAGAGKDKKRVKMQQARSIQIQNSPSPASSMHTSPAASPSSSAAVKSTRTLDVVNFAEARAFEINALHKAMESSRNAAAQRAFQSLPRNLRRRAASHNIKRLPVRLRDRAKREVEFDPVKKGKKPDNRYKRRRAGTLAEEYLRRQGTKRWLETHIWHAKRMKMVEIWGYKLAEHSNEHGIKSAYKSSHHQCIIQDSSYNGCLEITGTKKDISDVFTHMLDPTMPTIGSARYITGKRQYTTYLYEYDSFPKNLIAPATFLWKQDSHSESAMEIEEQSKQGQLWVWIHPSAFEATKAKIEEIISKTNKTNLVHVKDLENSLVMFDFTGPRSTALLKAVLQLSKSEAASPYQEAHKTWEAICNMRTSSSLPPGIVLGLLVEDPRLTFPHKAEARPASLPTQESKKAQEIITKWPEIVARSGIWDTEGRELLLRTMTSESNLNERRAHNLVPGTKLIPTEADSKVPVLLIQREGKPQIQRASGGGSNEFECGWTMVLPKGWAMPFWKSMVFAGARSGGLRERRSFHFETHQSCFPYDFPNTSAYIAYAEDTKKAGEEKYGHIPAAKRFNYAKMGVEDPFGAAWVKALKAGVIMLGGGEREDLKEEDIWILQTPKMVTALMDAAHAAGGSSAEMVSRLTLESLNLVMADCLQGLVKTALTPSLMKEPSARIDEALIRVGVDFLDRGTIGMNGMIYAIPEDQYRVWAARVQIKGKRTVEGRPRKEKKAKSWVDSDSDDEMGEDDDEDESTLDELEMKRPPGATLLGYVTTGQYCYSEGQSYGIGCVTATGLARVIELETRQRLDHPLTSGMGGKAGASGRGCGGPTPLKVPRMMVLVRSVRSKASRLAKLTIVS
ncbi:MAG: NUC188 domain-containing protein [Linnemannia gamsii]|nr:MAG: NUC188 domain-containing protein [Linnemannia gamsii]